MAKTARCTDRLPLASWSPGVSVTRIQTFTLRSLICLLLSVSGWNQVYAGVTADLPAPPARTVQGEYGTQPSGLVLARQERTLPLATLTLPVPAETRVRGGAAAAEHTELTIWDRLRSGFALQAVWQHPRVDAEVRWLEKNPAYLQQVAQRAEPFWLHLIEQTELQGMPLEIALLPVVESAFDPFAYSHGSAAGMWQFVPGTATRFGLQRTWWYDGRRDVIASTTAALRYLDILHRMFDGNWLHALASYNAGEGNVRKAIRRNANSQRATAFWDLDLPRETRGYVPRLLALARVIQAPEQHGQKLPWIAATPRIGVVPLEDQIDLGQAALLADLSLKELHRLNPGFNRWATDPNGPHRLVLPLTAIPRFNTGYAKMPSSERIRWVRHAVAAGDSLISIAKQYRTTPDLLRRVNARENDLIRQGEKLLVPTATLALSQYTLSETNRTNARQARQPDRRRAERLEHKVQPGDTLWVLSRKYGVSTRQLAAWNSMAPGDTLRAGRRLVIWQDPRQLANGQPRADGGRSVIRKVGYQIRAGDSLSRIAARFNVSVPDLIRWNTLRADSILRPGQMVRVFVDVTSIH